MRPLIALLRSARFAIVVISFLAVYAAVGAWLPWSLPKGGPPPAWAVQLGLDHPFLATPFLVAVAMLFASTLACTWGKRAKAARIAHGDLPPSATRLPLREDLDVAEFLVSQGFRRRGGRFIRLRAGLWGSYIMHIGLLALIAGVLVQQAFFDTAFFDLSEGGELKLRVPEALRRRERGLLAPVEPPDLEVRLQTFDAFASADGYAPDRRSQLIVTPPGANPVAAFLDRADGVTLGGVKFFQGGPAGLALILAIGDDVRSLHLVDDSEHSASLVVSDPAGQPARFSITTERRVDDPAGTGAMVVWFEEQGRRISPQRDQSFRFGGRDAKLTAISRWGTFSYARSPGMFGVFAGFAIILAGSALLLLPAGVARLGAAGDGVAASVYLLRGGAAMVAEWERHAPPSPARAS